MTYILNASESDELESIIKNLVESRDISMPRLLLKNNRNVDQLQPSLYHFISVHWVESVGWIKS